MAKFALTCSYFKSFNTWVPIMWCDVQVLGVWQLSAAFYGLKIPILFSETQMLEDIAIKILVHHTFLRS